MNIGLRIIAFCCNWCSYAAADLAGISRLHYPPSVRIIRVMCSGMVHPEMVLHALALRMAALKMHPMKPLRLCRSSIPMIRAARGFMRH